MPFTFRLGNLPKLDLQVDQGSDFEAWKTHWASYMRLSGLAEESAATMVQALTLFFSHKMLTIVNNLGLTAEQKRDMDTIITVIKCHIDDHINVLMEQCKLCQRVQQLGKSFDDF